MDTPEDRLAAMRDHAHTLSDFLCRRSRSSANPAAALADTPCGDARLPELLDVLADCPKAKAASVYNRCKAVYGKDSRWSTSASLKPS
jgi:hypothetical protein